MGMDDRKQRVLRAIVMLYGSGGEPVGSGLLAEHFHQAVSSATLRNEMAALTKLGLLEQPHTSAGRVPSAKGYRYYLDNLLDNTALQLSARDKAEIDLLFRELDYDPERLAQGAARALADMAGCTVVATTPAHAESCVAHYEVLQVGRCTAAVMAVTNAGSVRTRTAKLETPLKNGDVQRATAVLNAHLTFRNAADVDHATLYAAAAALGREGTALHPILSAAHILLQEGGLARVFVEGQKHLLGHYELTQSSRMLLELLEDSAAVQRYLIPRTERTTILLGEDVPDYAMPGLCIISKRYLAGGGRIGAMAMVGPLRMPYRERMPRLEYFARLLGEWMCGKAQEEM